MLAQLKEDIPYIENKYHKTSEPFNPYHRMHYHGWDCDPATGLDDAEMARELEAYVAALPDTDHGMIKARAFAFVLDHMRFGIDPHDYFVCLYNWGRPISALTADKWFREIPSSEKARAWTKDYSSDGCVTIRMDYDHTVPDWQALYEGGFRGILSRMRRIRLSQGELTEKQQYFYRAIDIEYSAILRLIIRMRDYAQKLTFEKAPEIAGCLDRLSQGAPVTLYDRLMLIYLYFMLSESIDAYQVRSLGNGLDHDLTQPYREDLAERRYTAEQLDGFIGYFLMQFSAIGNYWGQPFYLGGRNFDGSSRINEISYRILDIYDQLGIFNPKIQVKYSKTTPQDFLCKILDMIRRGHSSFVFICDDNVLNTFVNDRHIPYEQCYDYDVKGCYEYATRGQGCSSAPVFLNLHSPVLRAMAQSDDSTTYEELEQKYFDLLRDIHEKTIFICNEIEEHLAWVNPSALYSGTIENSLRTMRDAYADGCVYNSTQICVTGLASAVDALMALKTLVYDEKRVTLSRMKTILAENWSDTALRQRALNCPHKYGVGDPEADACARRIMDLVLTYQGRPNSRGSVYEIEVHSARAYLTLGEKYGATPDGRLAGEETSKNASPVPGMDRKGPTALIRSALAIRPAAYWGGNGLDIMIHQSATRGEDGLEALYELLLAYEANGGGSIQFNIVDVNTLKEAQSHPERYGSLQIRVCGWNALWVTMPKGEQDKFIERGEKLS